MKKNNFTKDVLRIDPVKEVARIGQQLRRYLKNKLKRRGVVIGLSGGIDSSVTAAIAAKELGAGRILALLMPENHSDVETLELSKMMADHLGIAKIEEDISQILEAVGFYKKYDDAVRIVIPEYGAGWKSKIVTPNFNEKKGFNLFSVVAQKPDDTFVKKTLSLRAYLEIIAATNFKQRIRKMLEYYHADRMHYAVMGTPNRLEYDQGFFVKLGDGAADIKPIAHLYKTQVYQLAKYLGIPEEIVARRPTTDTYSLNQGQDEFYFLLPYGKMDLCLYGKNNGITAKIVATVVGLSAEQVQLVYDDIDTKRATTRYLHLQPLLIEDVAQIPI
jgi:NAD+ synthase